MSELDIIKITSLAKKSISWVQEIEIFECLLFQGLTWWPLTKGPITNEQIIGERGLPWHTKICNIEGLMKKPVKLLREQYNLMAETIGLFNQICWLSKK